MGTFHRPTSDRGVGVRLLLQGVCDPTKRKVVVVGCTFCCRAFVAFVFVVVFKLSQSYWCRCACCVHLCCTGTWKSHWPHYRVSFHPCLLLRVPLVAPFGRHLILLSEGGYGPHAMPLFGARFRQWCNSAHGRFLKSSLGAGDRLPINMGTPAWLSFAMAAAALQL